MKRSIVKNTSKSRQRSRTASQELIKSLTKSFPDKKISVHALTGIQKKYSKKPVDINSSFVKNLLDGKDKQSISIPKLTEYLTQDTTVQKGNQLSNDAINRAYAAFCNQQGKMTFDYILKKCQQLGVPMTQRVAKGIVRKYGKRKDYLASQDCAAVINRRYANMNNKRPIPGNASNTPKKSGVRSGVTASRR